MELLLLFVGTMVVLGASAAKRGRVNRPSPTVVICVLVAAAYLSQRAL
jgi:hypothetical protein